MEKSDPGNASPPRPLAELVVRTLRHEVGDLLQTVYASVAILLERLGPELAPRATDIGRSAGPAANL